MTFEELGVREDLLRAITDLGYESPMPVQERVIPHLLNEESDVVALAQTGTGKTAAFGLPLLQRTSTATTVVQALILDPTRELCLQTASDLTDYAKYIEGLKILPIYGGANIEPQIRALEQGVHIIVATPGRLLDLLRRGKVDLGAVHTVVLDEADEMLNMGFIDDINTVLDHVPEQRKMLLFSATMPPEIARIAQNYMHNPQEFVIGNRNESSGNVRHIYYMVRASDKYLALKRIVDSRPRIYGIIFTRTRAQAQEIADHLIQDGYNADALHGDLSQAQRDTVMKKFRERNLQLLVATDVAARGLDVDDLTHIISYALPDDNDVYNHRSGRTGRAGKTGTSICIIHSRERGKLKEIEKHIGKQMERRPVPTPEEVIEKQLFNLADKLERVEVKEEEIAAYLPPVLSKLSWLNGEDLLKRLLSLEINRLLDYYRDAPVIEEVPEKGERKKSAEAKKRSKEEKDSRTAEKGFERVYINCGKADGFFAPDLIRLINQNTRGQQIGLGRIDLLSYYSLFDVRQGDAHRVVSALKGAEFYGKRVYAELAKEGKDYAAESWEKSRIKKNRAERRRAERAAREAQSEQPHGRRGRRTRRDLPPKDEPYGRFKKKKGRK